jgi:hypothetical protein
METDFVLKALNYGVIGLSAVMLVAAWRVLQKEQAREGYPRQGIVRLTIGFMLFCCFLAVLGTYVQVHKENSMNAASEMKYKNQLEGLRSSLNNIHTELCSKAVYEVWGIGKTLHPPNTTTLKYTIRNIDRSVRQAWLDAGGLDKDYEPCKMPDGSPLQ